MIQRAWSEHVADMRPRRRIVRMNGSTRGAGPDLSVASVKLLELHAHGLVGSLAHEAHSLGLTCNFRHPCREEEVNRQVGAL